MLVPSLRHWLACHHRQRNISHYHLTYCTRQIKAHVTLKLSENMPLCNASRSEITSWKHSPNSFMSGILLKSRTCISCSRCRFQQTRRCLSLPSSSPPDLFFVLDFLLPKYSEILA